MLVKVNRKAAGHDGEAKAGCEDHEIGPKLLDDITINGLVEGKIYSTPIHCDRIVVNISL